MTAAMQAVLDHIRFASDAEELLWVAAALFALAGFALYAERRRTRRARIDAVGFVPWTFVFFLAAFGGTGLGVAAIKGMIAG